MKIITDKEGKAAIENLLIVAIQAVGFDASLDTVVKVQKAIQVVEEPKPGMTVVEPDAPGAKEAQ